jgi:hypothetical protein
MKNNILGNLVYVTPKKGKRVIALYNAGVWIEVYEGEVLLLHKSREYELHLLGFETIELGDYPKLYKTEQEAEDAQDKIFKVIRGV